MRKIKTSTVRQLAKSVLKERVTQPTKCSCVAAVIAMATHSPMTDIFEHSGHDGSSRGFYLKEMIAFMVKCGYMVGTYPELKPAYTNYYDGGVNGAAIGDTLYLKLSMDSPAMLTVRSEKYESGLHAVFWDGSSVRDPNPDVEDHRPLSDYHILDIIPINLIWG